MKPPTCSGSTIAVPLTTIITLTAAAYRRRQWPELQPIWVSSVASFIRATVCQRVWCESGVSHGDELLMMFANDAFNGVISHDDKKVSALLMDLWTSLAAGGAPHSRLMAESTAWLPMDKDARRYLNVDAGGASTLTTQDLPFHARIPFWNRVLSREGEPNALHKDEL